MMVLAAACTASGYLRPAARHDPDPMIAGLHDLAAAHHRGHPHIRMVLHFHTMKSRSRHTDDRQGLLIHHQHSPEHRRIQSQPVAPEIVTQDDELVTLRGAVVVIFEEPPDGRPDSQDIEVVTGDILALHVLYSGTVTRIEAYFVGATAREHAGEEVGGLPELQIEGIRSIALAPAAGPVEIQQ